MRSIRVFVLVSIFSSSLYPPFLLQEEADGNQPSFGVLP
jgi:hypothetical protein